MDQVYLLDRIDRLYDERGRAGAVEESVVLSKDRQLGDLYEIEWRLARALFFLGQTSSFLTEKQCRHREAILAGQKAIELDPNGVEGCFWLGVNLALLAEVSRSHRAIRYLFGARRQLERAIRINEAYHEAGPLRVKGRLEYKAPRLLGGSKIRARRHLERALEIAPSNTVTLLYAAELEIDTGRFNRAIDLLKTITVGSIQPGWEFENARDRITAEALLRSLSSSA